MASISPKVLALVGLACTNLFWASNAVIARFAVTDIPPFTLASIRWFLACLFLLPFAWPHLRGQAAYIKQQIWVIALLGLLGIATYNTVLYLAAHATTAINITLVSSSLPLITLLMRVLILKVRPTVWQMLGIAVSLLGVLIVIARADLAVLQALSFSGGDILILLIACVWAVYSVILRKYPLKLHAIAVLTLLIIAGLPMLIALMLLEWYLLPPLDLGLEAAGVFVYVAIFPSILSYLFWGYGVKVLGPNIAALSCYLMPLFAALLAVPLLGESLYHYHFIGGALILLGLYLGSVFKQSRHQA